MFQVLDDIFQAESILSLSGRTTLPSLEAVLTHWRNLNPGFDSKLSFAIHMLDYHHVSDSLALKLNSLGEAISAYLSQSQGGHSSGSLHGLKSLLLSSLQSLSTASALSSESFKHCQQIFSGQFSGPSEFSNNATNEAPPSRSSPVAVAVEVQHSNLVSNSSPSTPPPPPLTAFSLSETQIQQGMIVNPLPTPLPPPAVPAVASTIPHQLIQAVVVSTPPTPSSGMKRNLASNDSQGPPTKVSKTNNASDGVYDSPIRMSFSSNFLSFKTCADQLKYMDQTLNKDGVLKGFVNKSPTVLRQFTLDRSCKTWLNQRFLPIYRCWKGHHGGSVEAFEGKWGLITSLDKFYNQCCKPSQPCTRSQDVPK